jgi:hypothetical protein
MPDIASYELHADMDPKHGSHLASLYAIFDRYVSWESVLYIADFYAQKRAF